MSKNIIIKNEYFTGIQTAINSLNEFIQSGFKVRNFPVLDEDYQLEPIVERVMTRLETVDPTWLEDESKVNAVIQMINDTIQDINPADGVYETIVNSNNDTLTGAIDSYVGFKMLQHIADNFEDFTKFINGIYTFNAFVKPSEIADVLNTFSEPLKFDEIPELDIEERIFDEKIYVDGIMKNDLISLPEDMDEEKEIERVYNRQDLVDIEIFVDDSVQEAAEVNYFEKTKPEHIKYNEKSKKWVISKEFEKFTDDLVMELRKCDTTEDLLKFFSKDFYFWTRIKLDENIVPYILVKVFNNTKKFPFDTVLCEDYHKSYESILKQNKGAKRFEKYDLFSTFKSDKEGTIKFIEDFFKLNLINDPDASISNNTLLTIFNIFDSRIYLDIAHNVRGGTTNDEDRFVKDVRGRINKNSRTKAAYKNDDGSGNDTNDTTKQTSKTVSESVIDELRSFGDMSISDMMYCEQYGYLVEKEIETISDKMYNANLSPFLIDAYIGESFNDLNEQLEDLIQEASVEKRRENLQTAVSALMDEMEKIVDMDKKHRWNNNSFVHRYKTTAGMVLSLLPNVTGSTEGHTDIKQVYKWTKKAIKGKSGNFTNEQLKTLTHLNDLTGDLWACVKLFWVNPVNWSKHMNLFNNTKIQSRVKEIAVIAKRIVDLKDDLEFLQDESFVREAYYDGSPDYVFQEATTKTNNERLNTAISLLMRDMKTIEDLSKKKQWTNNACINIFKSETMGNLKQAAKYINIAKGGSCGKYNSSDVEILKDLQEKIDDMLKLVKGIKMNPLIGKNIKESNDTRKVASIAKEILGIEPSLGFIKSLESATPDEEPKDSNEGETTQESFVFQESKQTHFKRTLKKFDYDPKTDTIKTDIDLPGGKEKMRVKLSIDDDIAKIYGPCVTNQIVRDPNGDYVIDKETGNFKIDPSKYEIHITRKALKQKEWKSAFALKHEEGHIAYDHINVMAGCPTHPSYDEDKAKGQEALAKKFIKDSKQHNQLNEHDRQRTEYVADKYAAEHTSKRTAINALNHLYKDNEKTLLDSNFALEDYEKARKELKIAKKKMKSLSPADLDALTKQTERLSEKIKSIKESNDQLKKEIDQSCKSIGTTPMEYCAGTDTNIDKMFDDLRRSIRDYRKLLKSKQELLKQNPVTLLNAAEKALDDMSEILVEARRGCKMRQKFIQKYVKEYGIIDLDDFQVIMEQEKGEIPEYMKTRFKMSDDLRTTVTPTSLPEGVPTNPIDDIADSVDAKMDTDGDTLGDMLGSGFENNPNKKDADGKIVVNITNNYTNSFNKDSNNTKTTTIDDHSTGKTTRDSNNNSSHHNTYDSSHNEGGSKKGIGKGSNNNNNSNEPADTKESIAQKDGKQKLSSGQTIQEMFMFLESKEPLSKGEGAGKPPKEDTLTKAMDADRKTLALQQKGKKGVQKVANTGRAVLKPITRTKQWLTKTVDSLIKRDEDQVKAEILDNPSYRSSVYKAARVGLKLGATGILFTLQPYLAAAYAGIQGLKLADKQRLKKEAQHELETELKIINEKIRELDHSSKLEDVKTKFEYMRLKGKMEENYMRITGSKIKHPRESW